MTDDTRLIAFYLPQYHPIAENSQWWGPGFTDWHNVARARPLYSGHYQPRMPRDLGFYDLRLAETREAQARLARDHGIHGFCYYTYWMRDGRRLLDAPMAAMLRDGTPDFPFCVCWANESWTRRWDGGNTDVLMEQSHDDANNEAFFRAMLPYFRDPRYITVDGRPLLLIYRATLFPDVAATILHWRAIADEAGLPPPYLVAVEYFDVPAESMVRRGFDAVCEFPPIMPAVERPEFTVPPIDMPVDFRGSLIDYEQLAAAFEQRSAVTIRRFRGVTLGWDNTPRRGNQATVSVNFSVARYREWLARAVIATRESAPPEERLVFINAWNEWAEGTYLEPDQRHGLAYLDATRDALHGSITDHPSAGAALTPAPVEAGQDIMPVTANEDLQPARFASPLHIVGIACVGNEADIVEAFVRENLRLFDRLLILEHNTIDGTRDILDQLVAEGLPITVEHSQETRFLQRVFTMRLLRRAIDEFSADWVMPIDSDEFLLAPSRAEFDRTLAAAGSSHLRVGWTNYVPLPSDDSTESHPLRRICHCYDYPLPSVEENPWVWKIIINVAFLGDYYLDRYEVCQGNHFITLLGKHQVAHVPMPATSQLRLAHFPIRSADNLGVKAALGLLSRLGASSGSKHYASMWQEITCGGISFETMASGVRKYLDTGRHGSEALLHVPTRQAPLKVTEPLRYDSLRLPPLAVLMKWIEHNLLTEEQLRDGKLLR